MIASTPRASQARATAVPCDECRDLNTHEFRSADDLLHALQTAAAEVDRGALRRIQAEEMTLPEEEALASALATEALPVMVRYRFQCTVCGDRFELAADTSGGKGGWTRQDHE
jgi:hypothetical protein